MRRILFLSWLVATVIWSALIFLFASYDTRPEAFTLAAKTAFVPSAIVFVIGLMLIWTFGGFSRRN
jgi:hypothetical protein